MQQKFLEKRGNNKNKNSNLSNFTEMLAFFFLYFTFRSSALVLRLLNCRNEEGLTKKLTKRYVMCRVASLKHCVRVYFIPLFTTVPPFGDQYSIHNARYFLEDIKQSRLQKEWGVTTPFEKKSYQTKCSLAWLKTACFSCWCLFFRYEYFFSLVTMLARPTPRMGVLSIAGKPEMCNSHGRG